MKFEEFYSEFVEQVDLLKDEDTYGWEPQDYFTAVILDYLEDIGEVESPIVCPYRDRGLQLDAYAIDDEYSHVTLFVSVYSDQDSIQNVPKTDIDAAFKRAIQIYRKATNDLYKSFERDNATYEFAKTIAENVDEIKNVSIIALTNGNCKELHLNSIFIGDAEISFELWDMDRLFRCMSSGKMRETIEIDFENEFNTKIPFIANDVSENYTAYLAIISGEVLAGIYKAYGSRLLEKNVRSFLQIKGAVNKGIRDTLANEPDMFLAYNNGISVTAERVTVGKTDDGSQYISKIRDMQIVNGGQTTASIYNITRDKNRNADLSKVFVQMKISVVLSEDKMDEVVHKISECANTQNKIQMADFSSNDPFNRKLEELSRTIWTPSFRGSKPINWFFERARGQYAEMLSREGTPARKKMFKAEHPLFSKTDMAKYENSWNQLPYFVSEGAQKNFKRFMVLLKDRGNYIPDEKYYQLLVAKAIFFRQTEKIVSQQKFGGYRANIVTYTIALLSHLSAQKIDLLRIWNEQQLSDALEKEVERLSHIVQSHIVNPPNGANIGEYCKKKDCWEKLLQNEIGLSKELEEELIEAGETTAAFSKKAVGIAFNETTAEEKALIVKVSAISGEVWLSISNWAKETNNLEPWQRGIAFSVGTLLKRGKTPSFKQAKQAEIIYEAAMSKGFIKG